jgi:hypothetical protein
MPPILIAGNPKNHALIAEVHLAVSAEKTGTTINGGIKGNTITGLEPCNSRPYRSDFSGGLVAHDDGRLPPACGAVKTVDIRPADGNRLDPHQDFIRGAYDRIRRIGKFQFFVFFH